MKLLDREPTPEMIAEMWQYYSDHNVTSVVGIFQAAYDAAPEIQQEPVKYEFQGTDGNWHPFIDQRHYENTVSDGSWSIRALYTYSPDAQAEIAKRDARINELEQSKTMTAVRDTIKSEALLENERQAERILDYQKFIATNTNRELTMKDRFFSAHDDFVADNNFDFDAGFLVTGDFVNDEKSRYAQMIACTLNDYNQQAAEISRLRGVIAKCEYALDHYLHGGSTYRKPAEEALAAIKEIG